MASIAVGLLGVLFASFAAISYTRSPSGNVFNIYSPYYSAIVAWAVPTIMWQEAEWLTQAQVEQQSHSSEEDEISNILIESVGLLVALYYTHVFVVLNLVSNGEQLGFRIFLGLFVPWVVYRWFTS
ncbi:MULTISPECIES: hypothetical protein [Halorussus]|uniref:hypothetical protein n=1 Tax=Halorussus TaxID=1070314 RepID=UPI0013B3D865|nr:MULTISPECIES: hypothetical protein [Halorussus]NHN59605.1 hypothetical protein [Halorussus sp. JP-T4]